MWLTFPPGHRCACGQIGRDVRGGQQSKDGGLLIPMTAHSLSFRRQSAQSNERKGVEAAAASEDNKIKNTTGDKPTIFLYVFIVFFYCIFTKTMTY